MSGRPSVDSLFEPLARELHLDAHGKSVLGFAVKALAGVGPQPVGVTAEALLEDGLRRHVPQHQRDAVRERLKSMAVMATPDAVISVDEALAIFGAGDSDKTRDLVATLIRQSRKAGIPDSVTRDILLQPQVASLEELEAMARGEQPLPDAVARQALKFWQVVLLGTEEGTRHDG